MAIRSLSAILAPVTNQLASTPSDDLQNGEGPDRSDHVVRKTILSRINRGRLGKLLAAGILSAAVCTSTGCMMTSGVCRAVKRHDGLDKFMINHRNKVMAAKAWHNEKHCFETCGNLNDIKAGYIQGYMDVAAGGDGCAPAVAPSAYWGWRYQSAGGQNSVNSWFQGYPLGVRAAERDGVGNWGQVRPNRAALQPQEAVYLPPPVAATSQDENPFYAEQFPYEPEAAIDDTPAPPTEVDDTDGPIRDAFGEGFDDEPMNLDSDPESPGDVGDAIRDALDNPSDSAQNNTNGDVFDDMNDDAGQVFGSEVSASEPEETGVRFSIDHDQVMERMFGDSVPPTATSVDPPTEEELPYTFD